MIFVHLKYKYSTFISKSFWTLVLKSKITSRDMHFGALYPQYRHIHIPTLPWTTFLIALIFEIFCRYIARVSQYCILSQVFLNKPNVFQSYLTQILRYKLVIIIVTIIVLLIIVMYRNTSKRVSQFRYDTDTYHLTQDQMSIFSLLMIKF